LVTKGSIHYRAPNDLVRRTVAPRPSAMHLLGDKLAIKDDSGEKKMDLGQWGPARALVASYLRVLGGDVDWLKAHYKVEWQCKAGAWTLGLAPTDPDLVKLLEHIRLGGKGTDLSRVEVIDHNGDRT